MPDAPLLDVCGLAAFYGDFQALFGVSIAVAPRQVVAIIGANGAGKSTLLKSIAGLMPARRAAVVFDGEPIGDLPAHKAVARGIALVPEGRRLLSPTRLRRACCTVPGSGIPATPNFSPNSQAATAERRNR